MLLLALDKSAKPFAGSYQTGEKLLTAVPCPLVRDTDTSADEQPSCLGTLGQNQRAKGDFQISLPYLAGVWAAVSRVVGLFPCLLLPARACGIWLVVDVIYRLMLVMESHQTLPPGTSVDSLWETDGQETSKGHRLDYQL